MSKRQTWTFEYTCRELLAAVQQKRDYHESKGHAWNARELRAKQEAQESVSVYDASRIGGQMGQTYQAPHVRVDPEKERLLTEATAHLRRHSDLFEQYDNWYRVFEGQPPEMRLALDYEDVLYFGLVPTDHPAEER